MDCLLYASEILQTNEIQIIPNIKSLKQLPKYNDQMLMHDQEKEAECKTALLKYYAQSLEIERQNRLLTEEQSARVIE